MGANKGKSSMVVFVALLLLVSATLSFAPATEAQTPSTASGKLLTNEDIISFVKAGLSDSTIVSLIQRSPKQFNLSPEALIKLRGAGVSNAVIEVMIGGSPTTSTESAKTPLIPTAYGYYVIDENKLVELKLTSVITKIGIGPGGSKNAGIAMDGFEGEPSIRIKGRLPIFIVYQQNIDVGDFHLRDLVYVDTKQAHQFNKFGTNQAFFRNVYGVDYYDVIQINLWRPGKEVPLQVEPVEGKSGMYRLIPKSPLDSGKYTLYLGNDVNPAGTIFSAAPNRRTSAFYFKIEP